MNAEKISMGRGTTLRKNGFRELKISIEKSALDNIYLINGTSFFTENIGDSNLLVKPNDFFMIINDSYEGDLEIIYDQDISEFQDIYDPYKYENSDLNDLDVEVLKKQYDIPEGYVDTLPKWYSFKFTYPEYNIIIIRANIGISFQIHDHRNEFWEILKGEPIIIVGNELSYHVKGGKKFEIPINTIHSIINPNLEEYVLLKERWSGIFDENDIDRIYNPNNYQ